MKVALIGYGRMGKVIEGILLERGHEISVIINHKNDDVYRSDAFAMSDVAIEFTFPESAYDNIKHCIDAGVPVISGTTGWNDKVSEMKDYAMNHGGAFLTSSNFSVGVNIFFALSKKLATMMNNHPAYHAQVTEIHHTTKLDSPSGTGITLAQDLIDRTDRYTEWVNEKAPLDSSTLPIISERITDAPGTHIIDYVSDIDDISIKHEAKSRKGFALGAVLAAEWIIGRKGIFTMNDVLGIN